MLLTGGELAPDANEAPQEWRVTGKYQRYVTRGHVPTALRLRRATSRAVLKLLACVSKPDFVIAVDTALDCS